MIKTLLKPLFLLFCFLSIQSQALPILQADAFVQGDNKASLEIDTGLIWMDFGVNSNRTYADVVNSLSTDYVGWRLPSTSEVEHLWLGLFGSFPDWQPWNIMHTMEHDDYFNQVADVMGTNGDGMSMTTDANENITDQWLVKSMVGIFESSPNTFGLVAAWIPYDDIHTNDALYFEAVNNIDSSWHAALLVKDPIAVPEPQTLILLALGLFGLVIGRIRTT